MIKLTLSEVVQGMGGRARGDVCAVSVGGVSTDSRTAAASDLFFALRGPHFDGHEFVAAALKRGAIAAVVETPRAAALERELEAAGVPPQQAKAEAQALAEVLTSSEVATARDVERLESKIELLRSDLSGKFTLLQWMLGLLLAGVASLILKAFF